MCNKEAENALLPPKSRSRKEAGSQNQQKSGFGLGLQLIYFVSVVLSVEENHS